MTDQLSIYIAQLNPTVGAVEANCERIAAAYADACAAGADIMVTQELSIVGYPTEDLVLKPYLVKTAAHALEGLAALTAGEGDPALCVGLPYMDDGALYNAYALLYQGEVAAIRYKSDLPNYGVFDEKRIFTAATSVEPVEFRGVKIGFLICEDMWSPLPAKQLADKGAELFIVPNGSPFEVGKCEGRLAAARARVSETSVPMIYLNQVGGQDELVFDGTSFILNSDGALAHQLASWREDGRLVKFVTSLSSYFTVGEVCEAPSGLAAMYDAMVLGLRDYVLKNGFPSVVLGLSGGIDSALSAAVAVDALGADKVHAVMMPSRYTSGESVTDAEDCAHRMGIAYTTIAIEEAVTAFGSMLAPSFEGRAPDTTEENLQSRIRGVTLMALSNKFGHMVLTTGNKSEMSVGYATLYGDMCGGYSVLKDVYKLDVFALCHWRNAHVPATALAPLGGEIIPPNIIAKPPTAELREGQKDEDSLPPYERLDEILRGLVDNEESVADIVARGFALEEVARIERLLYIAEYKRRQSPPGVKITSMNFGRDRRYPITNGFRSARLNKV